MFPLEHGRWWSNVSQDGAVTDLIIGEAMKRRLPYIRYLHVGKKTRHYYQNKTTPIYTIKYYYHLVPLNGILNKFSERELN